MDQQVTQGAIMAGPADTYNIPTTKPPDWWSSGAGQGVIGGMFGLGQSLLAPLVAYALQDDPQYPEPPKPPKWKPQFSGRPRSSSAMSPTPRFDPGAGPGIAAANPRMDAIRIMRDETRQRMA